MKKLLLLIFILLTHFCVGQKTDFSKSMNLYKAVEYKHYLELYKIDTVENKKVVIHSLMNKETININFDSITSNKFFIVGYQKQKIKVYNYFLKELKLSKVKAVRLSNFPVLEIIQNNKLKRINLIGTKYKRGDGPQALSFEYLPGESVMIKINQKEGQFYLHADYIYPLVSRNKFTSYEMIFKMYHTENVIETEYYGEEFDKINIYSEGTEHIKYPFLIYTKLKNGKYNLNSIDYLIAEKTTSEIELENSSLPKDLDNITKINRDTYLIEKNGLFTYYPLVQEIKYKNITEFQGNFARFELPNGKKGWLSVDGKEYLDE